MTIYEMLMMIPPSAGGSVKLYMLYCCIKSRDAFFELLPIHGFEEQPFATEVTTWESVWTVPRQRSSRVGVDVGHSDPSLKTSKHLTRVDG